MSVKRDLGLDLAKTLAMFLVVFIHVGVYAPEREIFRTSPAIENFCMVSTLPMFLMLSGLFSRRLFGELSVRRLLSRLLVYLWPVVTFIAVPALALRVFSNPPSGAAENGFLKLVFSAGWFFFCLSLCESMTFLAHYLSGGRWCKRGVLLAAGYLILWAMPYGMFHAVEMLPFFWFGVYVLPRLCDSRKGFAAGFFSLTAFIVVCVVAGDFRDAGLIFHWTSMKLLDFTWQGLGLMLSRVALGLLGGYGLLTAVRELARLLPAVSWLSAFGRESMGIFFLHILLLSVYYRYCGWCSGGVLGRVLLTVVAFLVSYAVSVLTKRNRMVSGILWNPMTCLQTPAKTDSRDDAK